jgi:hypothetical protein
MAENKKTAIVGIHDNSLGKTINRILSKIAGYETNLVMNMEDMRNEMDSNPNSSFYIMDINLGHPGSSYVEPALEIYNKLKDRIEKGETKFYGISGSPKVLEIAIESGIPKEHLIGKEDDRFFGVLSGRE